MCGIIGYVGSKKANDILIKGLLALEYRGYDSAGIATLENNEIKIMKDKGRVKNILNLDGYDDLQGTYGIAHTRWATHGKPSKENSHPHFDNTNTFAVVHNGIIENYNELREFLIKNGYKFYSQTDTEVIPNLINYYFNQSNKTDDLNCSNSLNSSDNSKNSTDSSKPVNQVKSTNSNDTSNSTISANLNKILQAVSKTTKDLKGSYAIEVISPLIPEKIIVARKDSPLVIGTKSDENYIASDIPALLAYTKDFYLLDDNEIAVISKNSISFYNTDLENYEKQIKNIEWDASAAEKNGYEDYMLKEIYEQPNSIRETVGSRLKLGEPTNFADLNITSDYLKNVNKIYIVACGTAMHAGLVGKVLLEKLCKIPTEVVIELIAFPKATPLPVGTTFILAFAL